MKNIIVSLIAVLVSLNVVFAQDAKVITLEQTQGEFTVKEMTVSPGEYIFEVKNSGIDHEVALVLAPEGKTDKADHIQAAYLKETVKAGGTATSNLVNLTPGTYVYFCPLNPTPHYKLIVKE